MKIQNLSKEQLFQLEEMVKCKNDCLYFIEHYVKIPTPGGSELFKLYEPQKDVIKTMVDDHYLVTLKSRQVGMSTLSQAYVTWAVSFFENVVIGILSRSGDEASDFNRKITTMIDELPEWMRPEYEKRTEQTFMLKNGCKSYSSGVNPANPSSVFRGKSLSILIIDEAAFIPCSEESFTSCGPSLVKAQKSAKENGNPYATFIISTPNKTSGTGAFYYKMWTKANSGESIYKPVVLKWNMIKEFADDPNWYKTQCEILNNVEWRIAQELNCEFIQGGDSFLPAKTIRELQAAEKDPIREINLDGAILKQWKDVDKDRYYLIGIDTASAFGTDSSTIEVIDFIDCEQVAELKFKGRVDEFCPIIAKVATIYNNHLIIPEANSFGNQVYEYLTRIGGEFNLYQSKERSPILNSAARNKLKFRYGIYTNPKNRPLIIDALYTAVTENPSAIKSRSAILELIGLVHDKNGKIQAEEGEHDDLSMALGFCFYVREYDPPTGLKSLMADKNSIEDSLDIINWNNDGSINSKSLVSNPYSSEEELRKHDFHDVLNKQIQNFINDNLSQLINGNFDMLKGSSTVDVLTLIGNNFGYRN